MRMLYSRVTWFWAMYNAWASVKNDLLVANKRCKRAVSGNGMWRKSKIIRLSSIKSHPGSKNFRLPVRFANKISWGITNRRKTERQRFHEAVSAIYRNVRVVVANECRRLALRRTGRSFAPRMAKTHFSCRVPNVGGRRGWASDASGQTLIAYSE